MRGRTLVLCGLAAGVLFRRRKRDADTPGEETADRWHVVTVNRPEEAVAPGGRLPPPLAELGDEIEVQCGSAPGDRGTELAARLRRPVRPRAVVRIAGKDPRQRLRKALRDAKSLVETGEVLSPHEPPTTRSTVTGLPVDAAVRLARGEGRL